MNDLESVVKVWQHARKRRIPPTIYDEKRSGYNARERHSTINRGPTPECTVPPPLFTLFASCNVCGFHLDAGQGAQT